jgi:hypothetical protein
MKSANRMSTPERTDESPKYVILPHQYTTNGGRDSISSTAGVPAVMALAPVLATRTPPSNEYNVDLPLSDVVVDRPILAEPGSTLNWRSGSPLIGPRRAEVDPEETLSFLNSCHSAIKLAFLMAAALRYTSIA